MRSSAWSSLAISACRGDARLALGLAALLALTLAGPAAAHVDATPPFLAAGGEEVVLLTAHNDRTEEMTGFSVSAPEGVELDGTDAGDWRAEGDARTATWAGGRVPANTDETFRVLVRAPSEPGPVELTVKQLYPGGEDVEWPVRLTITPAGTPSSSSRSTLAALLTAGLLVTGALLFLARRRDG